MNWLNKYFSAVVRVAGINLPMRGILEVIGSGVTASDTTLDDGTPVTRLTIAGGGGSSLPVTRTVRSTAVPSNITTADDLVRVTAVALQTLPGAPSDGHTYEVCNDTAGNNDVNGGGHNINVTGAATMTLGPKQSITFTYCLASTTWLAS